MPLLNDIIRLRCEPQLKLKLRKAAKEKRLPYLTFVRQILWDYIDSAEGKVTVVKE